MRVAELARRSGVPVPTIKYYLREGLLPPGELTSPNQARYAEEHVRRLKLVRALVEVGGLSIAQARDVLAAIDTPEKAIHDVLGVVQKAMSPPGGSAEDESWEAAQHAVAELVQRRKWHARADGPAGQALASVIVSMWQLGHEDFVSTLDHYAAACERIAEADVAGVVGDEGREAMVEHVVVGTVIGDAAIAATRRLAHQDASYRRFGTRR